jgi:hypothetical protein
LTTFDPVDVHVAATDARAGLFDALTQHDERTYHDGPGWRGRSRTSRRSASSSASRRSAAIYPVLCGSGREHIGSSRSSTR